MYLFLSIEQQSMNPQPMHRHPSSSLVPSAQQHHPAFTTKTVINNGGANNVAPIANQGQNGQPKYKHTISEHPTNPSFSKATTHAAHTNQANIINLRQTRHQENFSNVPYQYPRKFEI